MGDIISFKRNGVTIREDALGFLAGAHRRTVDAVKAADAYAEKILERIPILPGGEFSMSERSFKKLAEHPEEALRMDYEYVSGGVPEYHACISLSGGSTGGCMVIRVMGDGSAQIANPLTLEWEPQEDAGKMLKALEKGGTAGDIAWALSEISGAHPYRIRFGAVEEIMAANREILRLYGKTRAYTEPGLIPKGARPAEVYLRPACEKHSGATVHFREGAYTVFQDVQKKGGGAFLDAPVGKAGSLREAERVCAFLFDHYDDEEETARIPLSARALAEIKGGRLSVKAMDGAPLTKEEAAALKEVREFRKA